MYNLHYIGLSNGLNSSVYTDQVTGLQYASQLEAEQAQDAVFKDQDTQNGVWTPRLQMSLVDRKALFNA